MPDTIYLFPTYYTVKGMQEGEGEFYQGRADHKVREIRIEVSACEEAKKSVMLHEIVHCIFNQASLPQTDEILADVLANGFLNIIRGNADLIKWLAEVE